MKYEHSTFRILESLFHYFRVDFYKKKYYSYTSSSSTIAEGIAFDKLKISR